MNAIEIAKNFEALEFRPIDISDQFSHLFFKELSTLYNTDPILLRFACSDQMSFLKCVQNLRYASNYRNIPLHLENGTILSSSSYCLDNEILKSLLTNRSINIIPFGLAGLTDGCNWDKFELVQFEKISPFQFEGLLAEIVSNGGLFVKSSKISNDIVNLARSFSDSIIQGNFSHFEIYRSEEAWSDYFDNRFWHNNTFIIFDGVKGEFWIVATADFD